MRLAPIDASNWRAASNVTVREDQLLFVAGWQPVALVILAKSYVGAEGKVWDPVAVYDDGDRIVGVAAIAFAESGNAELFHLALDLSQQGRGLAGRALGLLVDRAVSRGGTGLELSVHPNNVVAQRLYRRAGFEPTGGERDGEPVWSLPLPTRATGPGSMLES